MRSKHEVMNGLLGTRQQGKRMAGSSGTWWLSTSPGKSSSSSRRPRWLSRRLRETSCNYNLNEEESEKHQNFWKNLYLLEEDPQAQSSPSPNGQASGTISMHCQQMATKSRENVSYCTVSTEHDCTVLPTAEHDQHGDPLRVEEQRDGLLEEGDQVLQCWSAGVLEIKYIVTTRKQAVM